MTMMNGTQLRGLTNAFGYFRLEGLPAGETAILSAVHRLYSFDSRPITPDGELTVVELTPTR